LRDRKPLFFTNDGSAARQHQIASAEAEVANLPEERILNTDVDALVEYFVQKYSVEVPELDLGSVSASEHERQIEVYDRVDDRTIRVPVVAFDFEIPFTCEAQIFHMRPNSWDTGPPYAEIRTGLVCFTIADRQLTQEKIKADFERTRDSIQRYLNWHREMWAGLDEDIAKRVRLRIEERRNRLLQQKELASGLSSLGIKLKEKTGDAKTFVPPAVKQKIQPKLPPMRPAVMPEPTLDQRQYETILSLISGAGRSIEQSSSRTRALDEEALRDMLLVPLNAHFGNATGEAFNCNGKTDILIRHEGANLFAAECKIWGGDKHLQDAIDQLLSYLHWRDTKAALVVFNRNKDFSGVLEKLKSLPAKHSAYVSGPKNLDESSFQFVFSLPQDAERKVTVSVLAFDLGG